MPEPEHIPTRPDPVTDDDVRLVAEALDRVKGNRAMAARILNRDENHVKRVIEQNAALSAKWSPHKHREPLKPAETIDRPSAPKTLTKHEQAALALTAQEKKLNSSLSKLGFTETERNAIVSVEQFAGQHFAETMSIVHGGLVKSFMRLSLLAERIEADYLQDENISEEDRKYWWNQYFRILENLRGMNEMVNKAAMTQAIIDIKKKEANGGRGKPGFQPVVATQITVNSDKDVKIVTPDAKSGT